MRLVGIHPTDIPLPDRLFQLGRWIVKIAHEPVAPWWAAKYSNLHPSLLIRIEQRIRQSGEDFPKLARSIWNLLIEKFRNASDNDSLFKVKQRIEAEGWTSGVLRAFERSVTPHLKTESRTGRRFRLPPKRDWAELQMSDIAEFEVIFPYINDIESEIPDEVLPALYRIGRRQLELAVELLEDVNPSFRVRLRMSQINRMGKMDDSYPGVYVQWFRDLLKWMIETYPELVRSDMALWPEEEPCFFDGLRLYAWSFDTLFAGDEIGDGLLSLSNKTFWDGFHSQKLKQLLRDRWREFSTEQRTRIEDRIVGGRERFESESDEIFERRKSIQSATILGWLMSKGCDLSNDTEIFLDSFRETNPDWSPEWEEDADDDGEEGGGFVTTNPDPSVLLDAPLSQVIPLARKHTTYSYSENTDNKPFVGLIKQRPIKALAGLIYEAKRGDYPPKFWKYALEEWPENVSSRLTWLFGERLARLPSEIVINLRSELFRWLEKHLAKFAIEDQARALSILDVLLDKLFESGDYGTESDIGDVRVAGDSQGWSRRTMIHALNSSVGKTANTLLDFLNSQDPEEGAGVPSEVKLRLKRLVRAPGEGADHAICVIAHRLEWLHYLDPEWARVTIAPWFNSGHPYAEPAWNGLLHRNTLPGPGLFSRLRTYFLDVFNSAKGWKWHDERLRTLHESLVYGCLWRQHNEVYLTFPEVRLALQQTNDSGRAQTIEYLIDLIKSERNQVNWQQFGKRFLDEAWPRESSLQTEDTSIRLAQLAGVTGDDFPEAVETILPRLVPIYGDSWFLYRVVSRGGGGRV